GCFFYLSNPLHVHYTPTKPRKWKTPVAAISSRRRIKKSKKAVVIWPVVKQVIKSTIPVVANVECNPVIQQPLVFLQHLLFLEMCHTILILRIKSRIPYTFRTLIP